MLIIFAFYFHFSKQILTFSHRCGNFHFFETTKQPLRLTNEMTAVATDKQGAAAEASAATADAYKLQVGHKFKFQII